jgi:hypothetical protein
MEITVHTGLIHTRIKICLRILCTTTSTPSLAKATCITMGTTELPWAYSSHGMKLTPLLHLTVEG